jgi:hypothetical protein
MKLLIMQPKPIVNISAVQIFFLAPCSRTSSVHIPLLMSETNFDTIQNNGQNFSSECSNFYVLWADLLLQLMSVSIKNFPFRGNANGRQFRFFNIAVSFPLLHSEAKETTILFSHCVQTNLNTCMLKPIISRKHISQASYLS